MTTTAASKGLAESVATRFAVAIMFMGLWVLNSAFLFGALLLAAWGCVGLLQLFRHTPSQQRRHVMGKSVIAAATFLVMAEMAVGYSAGKYMARQDGAACGVQGQDTPNNSFQRTRCARR